MEGRQYLRLLRRNWLLLIVTALVVAGLATLAYQTAAPHYRTDLSFLVEASQGDSPSQAYQGGLLAQSRAPVYEQLVTSTPVVVRVRDSTNSTQSVEDLKAQFATTLESGSTLIEVSADAESARDSLQLAQAMADVYPTYVSGLSTSVGSATSVNVLDEPQTTKQVAPLLSRYAAIGVLLALFLGVVVIAIRESMSRRVRDADDLRASLPAQVVVARITRRGPAVATRLSPVVAEAATRDRVLLAAGLGRANSWTSYLTDFCRGIGDTGQPVVLIDIEKEGVTPLGLRTTLAALENDGSDVLATVENLRQESLVVCSLGDSPSNGMVQVPDLKNAQGLIIVERGRATKAEVKALADVMAVSGAPVAAVLLTDRRPRRKT